jgi:uncharacterized RDD family membrane protein YckC
MKHAGFWRQLFAIIIDQIVVLIPIGFIPEGYYYLAVANGMDTALARYYANVAFLILFVVFSAAYFVILNGRYGITLGRFLMKIKLIRLDEPNRDGIGYLRAAMRLLLFVFFGGLIRLSVFASIPLVFAIIVDSAALATILWMLIDARRRTLQDFFSGTMMVYDPAGRFPDFDPEKIAESKIRPVLFGATVVINTLASIFIALS